MKKIIRLTEQDLHRIVKESVKRALNEEQLIAENKLTDLIKQYGAKAVLAAAIAGGIGAATPDNFHLYGEDMPQDHRALFGTYAPQETKVDQNGNATVYRPQKAVLGAKIGNYNGIDMDASRQMTKQLQQQR